METPEEMVNLSAIKHLEVWQNVKNRRTGKYY